MNIENFVSPIWPGDPFSIKGDGALGWSTKNLTVTPSGQHTDQVHFGLIAYPVFDDDGGFVDYVTHESLGRGPSESRFFKYYLGADVSIYRIPGITRKEGIDMALSTSEIGRKSYGYVDFICLGVDAANLMVHGKFPPYTAQQLKYSANDDYICTEELAYAMRHVHHPVEPPGQEQIWDIPTVYLQAEEEGRLLRWHRSDLRALYESLKGKPANVF